MSVIGMNSRGNRKPPTINQQVIIDRLKKARKDYKLDKHKRDTNPKSTSRKSEDLLNEVFDLIDKL
tara:strand:- start:536 stop:733 length:198 start_codon:yes stop_codon:yes gene_type:complete